MTRKLAAMLNALRPDPWRSATPFSKDLAETSAAMWAATGSVARMTADLARWLANNQPCIFGRVAARLGYLSYCIVTEADLLESNAHVLNVIQAARRRWWADAYRGERHGFIIAIVSEKLALAQPGRATLAIAKLLARMYLSEEVSVDAVALDQVWLRIPGRSDAVYRWKAGVNYFASHADGRWWHDHRIPGGIAFSTNSVGHMVKSSQLAKAMGRAWDTLGMTTAERAELALVADLSAALGGAMRTIAGAAVLEDGAATRLLPAAGSVGRRANPRPSSLGRALAAFDHTGYAGSYHTDHTLPSVYFLPGHRRPSSAAEFRLDLTYLTDPSMDNPDHVTMGVGERIAARNQRSRRFDRAVSRRLLSKEVALRDALKEFPRTARRRSRNG